MKYTLILLPDNAIIVSDEEINKDCYYMDERFNVGKSFKNGAILYKNCKKVIAGLPSLPNVDFNNLEEKFGLVDGRKFCIEKRENNIQIYLEGFNKALSLNDKKWSDEQVLEMIVDAILKWDGGTYTANEAAIEVLQSLSKLKTFDIECIPNTTNNSLKIIKKL